jgi:hypothetical protein
MKFNESWAEKAYSTRGIAINNKTLIKLNPYFVTGLSDAESTFLISINKAAGSKTN